jgi:hypothetical protein
MLGLYHISYYPEVDRQNSCARGGVLVSKRKAQLAPGFPTIRVWRVFKPYHGGLVLRQQIQGTPHCVSVHRVGFFNCVERVLDAVADQYS